MPSISRRRLLTGGAVLGSIATLGYGAFAPANALPDGVARTRAELRPIPEVRARPTVTAAHVEAAIADVESTIERAAKTWDRVDDHDAESDDLPGLADPARSIDSARDYLDDARSNDGWRALFDARRAAQFAGEAIGGARLALGEADGETLAANAREILDAVAAERDRVTYVVADPASGLAQLYFVEKSLQSARLNAYRGGVYTGQQEPTTEYSDHDVVRTWGSHMLARRTLADARRLYDDHQNRIGEETAADDDDRRDLGEHVVAVDEQLRAEARERAFTVDEFDERHEANEALPEGPYRTYRWQTMYYVQNGDVQRADGLWVGLPLYRAVHNAEFVIAARAFESLRADEPLSPDDDAVSGARLDDVKTDALALLDEHRDDAADDRMLERLLEEGRRLVWAGDNDLEHDGDVDHPRARALADYALGREYLRSLPEVREMLASPSR